MKFLSKEKPRLQEQDPLDRRIELAKKIRRIKERKVELEKSMQFSDQGPESRTPDLRLIEQLESQIEELKKEHDAIKIK